MTRDVQDRTDLDSVDRGAAEGRSLDRRAAGRLLGAGLIGAALLVRGPRGTRASAAQAVPGCDATPAAPAPPGPNLYELHGPSLTVTYSTSGIVGEPQLVLADAGGQRTFAGDVIRAEATAIGRLVTVELAYVPDFKVEHFSLLLPAVGPVAVAPEIAALAIYTTERTTIGGPALVEGANQSYRVVEVMGTARSVVF